MNATMTMIDRREVDILIHHYEVELNRLRDEDCAVQLAVLETNLTNWKYIKEREKW